jgi:hypothetical protein
MELIRTQFHGSMIFHLNGASGDLTSEADLNAFKPSHAAGQYRQWPEVASLCPEMNRVARSRRPRHRAADEYATINTSSD